MFVPSCLLLQIKGVQNNVFMLMLKSNFFFYVGKVFLDMTFGSGGHTKAMLQKEPDITVYALDRDPTAYALAEQLAKAYP